MYIPQQYENKDLGEVKEFISENSFGILINSVEGKPWGTHIPLELFKDADGNDCLEGHLSKANIQWQHFKDDAQVLAIFNGPHSYVSSSWYDYEEVPTWNYIAVHVYGTLRLMNEEALLDSLKRLVNKYEAGVQKPISVENLAPKTMRQIRGIVGFTINIQEIQAAYKLSQNKSDYNHAEVIKQLKEKGAPGSIAIADRMKRQR